MPKIARAAYVVAFLTALLCVVSAAMGQWQSWLFALIPLAAGIGILRKRVWSAYGYAVILLAQLVLVALVLLRATDRSISFTGMAGTRSSPCSCLCLCWLDGHWPRRVDSEARPGHGWCWQC